MNFVTHLNMHIMENSKLSHQNIHFLSKNTDLKCSTERSFQQVIILKPKHFPRASRRKCAESGENPIFRDPPKIYIFWSIWG
jgi:hypothetical protein